MSTSRKSVTQYVSRLAGRLRALGRSALLALLVLLLVPVNAALLGGTALAAEPPVTAVSAAPAPNTQDTPPADTPADTPTADSTTTDTPPGDTPPADTPAAVVAEPPPAAEAPPTGTEPATEPTTDAPDSQTGSFSPSAALRAFLGTLNLQLGAGPLSGTVADGVVTVALNAPTVPITLPAGGPTITFGGATLAADTNTDTVTVSASATAGILGATLTVTATHASSTLSNPQISGTVTVTGLSILGATVGLEGTLAYANGSTSVSLSGTLTDDVAIADGFVLRADSTVSVSTTEGLAVHGRATVGPAGSSVDVTVDGSVRNADDWSLTVASKDAQPISPVDGFQITPNVSGTIAKADGKVGFTLAGTVDASWKVDAATMTVSRVVFSNQEPENGGVNCAEEIGVKAGQLWLGVSGSVAVDSVGVAKVDAEGCVNLTSKAFSVATTVETDAKPGVGGISITKATLKVSKEAGGKPAVTAAATLQVAMPGRDDITFPGQVSITADGAFIAGGSIDLDALKLGTDGSNGVLLFASKAVTGYDATALGIADPVDLKQGATVLLTYKASDEVNRALAALHLPKIDTLQVSATLSSTGVSLKGRLVIGTTTGGATLYHNANGAAVYLDSLDLGISTNGSDVMLSVGGSAYLVLPPMYAGAQKSEISLSLNGSIDVSAEAVTVALGFDIAAQHGPWTDAFGIEGLSVDRLAGKFGVTITPEDAGIPLPTIGIRVDNLKLPTAWGNAIGVVDGSLISLNLSVSATNPIVDFTIVGPQPGAIALRPFTIAKTLDNSTPQSIVNLVEVTDAHLLFAPLGGRDAANEQVSPGIELKFTTYIDGRRVKVEAGVGLDPFPHLHADIAIPDFTVGTLKVDNTHLVIDLDANPTKPVAKLVYSGGFTDKYTGIGFHADIDTGVTGKAANAAVTLTATAGLPSYFDSALTLSGAVSATSQGLILWGNGYASLRINGKIVGGTGFSYSSDVGAGWAKLPTTFAKAYKDAYNWLDRQVAAQLKAMNFTNAQIALGLAYAFNEGVAGITAAMNAAGIVFNDAAAAVKSAFNVADQEFANALWAAHYGASQIASVLHWVYGEGDRKVASVLKTAGVQVNQIVGALKDEFQASGAALYNALQSIGSGGQSALDAINSYFNTGAYNIWTYPTALSWTLGTSNGWIVTSWFNAWSYDQQWYVLPTDGGYAEIVNRGSGQCLTVNAYSKDPTASLVQYTCYGDPAQQWYLGSASSGKNIGGLSTALKNRNSGFVADVLGQNWRLGATVGQYYRNSPQSWNQTFTFLPAIG